MRRLFGTDGVRGVANTELTAELAYQLGRAGGYVLTREAHHAAKVVVGMDTRISGDMLEAALVAGLCSIGADVISLGVVPTPAVAILTRQYGADAGVVISASHNPYEFNGIKFFDAEGFKLPDSLEDEIEKLIREGVEKLPNPTGDHVGRRLPQDNAVEDYVAFIKTSTSARFEDMRIVIDCANGAAFQSAPLALMELGAEVTALFCEPDGININADCGSTHLGKLQAAVRENKAQIGIAFDGDADRMLAVDENGNIVDGDQIMAIIGLHLKNKGALAGDTIVCTVMSNLGFDIFARENGLHLVKAKVGDRYVLEEMKEHGYVLGGEQSGHVIMLSHNTTGDGLLSAVQLLTVLKETGKPLSQLAGVMNILPQVLVNAKVRNDNKHSYLHDVEIKKACDALEAEFHGEGRVLIRPSGTEPLVRVMIEGKDPEYIRARAKELAVLIEKRLG